MEIQNKHFFISSDFVLYKGVDEEKDFFLFNVTNGKVFNLNETSYIILETFSEDLSLSEVFETLKNKFNVSEDILFNDLAKLIKIWIDIGLLICKD